VPFLLKDVGTVNKTVIIITTTRIIINIFLFSLKKFFPPGDKKEKTHKNK
jgi:hypothetical protein